MVALSQFQTSVCSHNVVQALKLKANHDTWDWLAYFGKTAKLSFEANFVCSFEACSREVLLFVK